MEYEYDLLNESSPEGGRWADQAEENSPTLAVMAEEIQRLRAGGSANTNNRGDGSYFLDLSGLPGTASEDALAWFFSDKKVAVENIEISMKGEQSTGMALLEVADERSYEIALKLDKSAFKGRQLRIMASNKTKAPVKPKPITDAKGKGKGEGKGDGKKGTATPERSSKKGKDEPKGKADEKGKAGKKDDGKKGKGKDDGKGKGAKGEKKDASNGQPAPAERKKIQLLPRSVPVENDDAGGPKSEPVPVKPKVDPFGGAKPRDENMFVKGEDANNSKETKTPKEAETNAKPAKPTAVWSEKVVKTPEPKEKKDKEKDQTDVSRTLFAEYDGKAPDVSPSAQTGNFVSARSSPTGSATSATDWSRGGGKRGGKGGKPVKKEEYVWRVAGLDTSTEPKQEADAAGSRARGRGKKPRR